jgi:GNAT superfamily N-acetyltransferase
MNYDSKSFFIRKDLHSGTIDMALMDNTTLPNTRKIKKRGQVWYYFNRLVVHGKIRHQGIATRLMQEMVEWVDYKKINVLLEINPYGDLDLEQLIIFYGKFGFKHYCRKKDTMIRVVY